MAFIFPSQRRLRLDLDDTALDRDSLHYSLSELAKEKITDLKSRKEFLDEIVHYTFFELAAVAELQFSESLDILLPSKIEDLEAVFLAVEEIQARRRLHYMKISQKPIHKL